LLIYCLLNVLLLFARQIYEKIRKIHNEFQGFLKILKG